MTASDYARNRGKRIKEMRQEAGITLEDMAFEIGISRASVARIETGEYVPDLDEWKRICDVCHRDSMRSLLAVLKPDIYAKLTTCGSIGDTLSALDDYLHHYSTEHTQREIAYMVLGDHGSDAVAIIELVTAYLHLPLYMRHGIAHMILASYKEANRLDILNCPDNVQPDIVMLDNAIEAGTKASLSGKERYNL